MPITRFERLAFRQPRGKSSSFIKDELGAQIFADAGFVDYQPFIPVTTFLNGRYYGLTYMKPPIHRSLFAQRYGTSDDNFQILSVGNSRHGLDFSIWYSEIHSTYQDEEVIALMAELNEVFLQDLTNDENFQRVVELVDIDNLLLYYVIQLSINNRDWPHHNYRLWRYQGDDRDLHPHLDGRWRYVAFDLDGAFDMLYSQNQLINYIINPNVGQWHSKYLENLLQRSELREQFANFANDLRMGALSEENLSSIISELSAKISFEIEYGRLYGMYHDWQNENQVRGSKLELINIARYQTQAIHDFLVNEFNLSGQAYDVEIVAGEGVRAKLSSLRTHGGSIETISGQYFVEHGVQLTYEVSPHYEVYAIKMNGVKIEPFEILELSFADVDSKTNRIEIEIFSRVKNQNQSPIIYEIYNHGRNDWVVIYNPNAHEISLSNYCLNNNARQLCQWRFPNIVLDGGERYRIFGRSNRTQESWRNHILNFNLARDDYLRLTDASSGEVVSSVRVPLLMRHQSFRYNLSQARYLIEYVD
jgi:hypothetical protein